MNQPALFPPPTDAMQDCRVFFDEHPDLLRQIVSWIRLDIERGYRPSVKACMELLRRYHYVKAEGRPYALNNNWSGPLTRILRERYPDLREHLPMRKSKWDDDHQHAGGDPE